jgi:hypothetical protein
VNNNQDNVHARPRMHRWRGRRGFLLRARPSRRQLPGALQRKELRFRGGTAGRELSSRARKRVARAKKAVVRKPSISLRSRVTNATHRIPGVCTEIDTVLRQMPECSVVSPSCARVAPLDGLGSGLALLGDGKSAWEAAWRDPGSTYNHPSRRRLDTIRGLVYRSASPAHPRGRS